MLLAIDATIRETSLSPRHRFDIEEARLLQDEAQIFLVVQSIGSTLEDADLVVEALDEAERDLVLWLAVGGDAVPVALDHVGKALFGLEALPLEAGAPVVEEAPCPAFAPVVPELAEGFFQEIGGIEALVGGQQQLEGPPTFQGGVLVARQQRVLLALDEASALAAEAVIFGLAHLVERFAEVAHDVELVEQDGGLRRLLPGDVAERLPHVHDGEPDLAAFFRPQLGVEPRHARLGPVLAAELGACNQAPASAVARSSR